MCGCSIKVCTNKMDYTKLSDKWNTKTGHLKCCLPKTGFTTCSATNDNGCEQTSKIFVNGLLFLIIFSHN